MGVILRYLGLLAAVLLLTGCGIDFKTDLADGSQIKENNVSIRFYSADKEAKVALNLKKRVLDINGEDRTADTEVLHRHLHDRNPLEILYTPSAEHLLPDGNVTVTLEIPYRKRGFIEKIFGISSAKKSLHLFIDTVPPLIFAYLPENNTTLSDRMTALIYEAKDDGVGIDPESLTCYVNDSNWSGVCSMENGLITVEPDSAHPLPFGSFEVRIALADHLGNRSENRFEYTGRYDTTPPSIIMTAPRAGEVITDPLTTLIFKIYDDVNGTGIDTQSVILRFPDENRSVRLTKESNSSDEYLYRPEENSPLPYGAIPIEVSAADRAGNRADQRFSLFLREKQSLSAMPVAVPSSAYAPATIRFYPKTTTDTAIVYYNWDMDGNGAFETSNFFPDSTKRTYVNPGEYRVGLEVVDANGKRAQGYTTVRILNAPPTVSVDLQPSNGPVPLNVHFKVAASDREGIAKYQWDFDGDGTWDYESTATGDTDHLYETTGTYNARLKVTDRLGAATEYTTPTTTVLASSEGAPSVTAIASALEGAAPLTIAFDANASDPKNEGFTLYQWDFDGDGSWDYNSSQTPKVSHTYTKAGTFYPKVRATTADGRVTFDALSIDVSQKITLSVSNDTIDPSEGGTSTISTTLSADTTVQLVIEDSQNNPVRILVPWRQRGAGTYEDSWNGRGEGEIELKEGPYYAVLYYKEGAKTKKLDLRETTGGIRNRMSRSRANWRFAPYNNDPVRITFTIPRAAEVISFMGYTYSNTRIMTFRNRQPLGRGSYTDIWYSQNDDGAIVKPPPGKYFLYGAWWYTMPDNTIYVKGGVHIGELSISPPIFTPTSHEEEGVPKTLKISFDLSRPATAELVVYDASTGTVAATREYKGLDAGTNTVAFDGRDNHGVRLRPGSYTVGVRAVDERGYRSIMRYNIMRIAY